MRSRKRLARADFAESTSPDDVLGDRRTLDRIAGDLSRGFSRLDDEAMSLDVPVPALAAALERAHGAVPAPPPERSRRRRRVLR
jgi:hypothetical protein